MCLLLKSKRIPGSKEAPADEFYDFNLSRDDCNLFIPGNPKSGVILYDADWGAHPFSKKIERTDLS